MTSLEFTSRLALSVIESVVVLAWLLELLGAQEDLASSSTIIGGKTMVSSSS